ncbi:CMP-binding protein, partial [Candidatus Woesearchaeota archaeon]|nr:CMP-binding protein [Candidatus Woesearchaeota archaeon]
MPRRYVTDLKDGDVVDEVFLVADKQLRANRNAALYLTVDLRDRTGVVNARMWNVSEESCSHIQVGSFARIKGKVQLYQGTLQLILTHIDSVAPTMIDPVDFEPISSQKIDELFDQL